jgi:hypothetical protein
MLLIVGEIVTGYSDDGTHAKSDDRRRPYAPGEVRTSVATAVKITYRAVVAYVLLLKAWLGLPSFPILAVPTPMMDAKSQGLHNKIRW